MVEKFFQIWKKCRFFQIWKNYGKNVQMKRNSSKLEEWWLKCVNVEKIFQIWKNFRKKNV